TAPATVTGLQEGTTTIRGTAPTLADGELVVTVTSNLVILPLLDPITIRQSLPFPVRLSRPAPPGGVIVTLTSSDPAVVQAETPTVAIPGGDNRGLGSIVGGRSGSARITGSHPDYASDQTDI